MSEKQILNFIYELGTLQRIKHEGWKIAGIKDPESVAEHSLRAAQIAFILAKMEGHKQPHKIATMLVFHDIGECRIGDIHKVANRYIDAHEEQAVKDQTKPLKKLGEEILSLWQETEEAKTEAGKIAKDADLLEQAITAKEYQEQGYLSVQNWLTNIKKALKTKSAKDLFKKLSKTRSTDWWQGLKKH